MLIACSSHAHRMLIACSSHAANDDMCWQLTVVSIDAAHYLCMGSYLYVIFVRCVRIRSRCVDAHASTSCSFACQMGCTRPLAAEPPSISKTSTQQLGCSTQPLSTHIPIISAARSRPAALGHASAARHTAHFKSRTTTMLSALEKSRGSSKFPICFQRRWERKNGPLTPLSIRSELG